jgi:PLP dependent protein
VQAAVEALTSLAGLRVRGLMTIPPAVERPEDARGWFRALRKLAERHGLADLSMGMSGDFEVAVEEGATMVRVGTAIFGPRPPRIPEIPPTGSPYGRPV